MASITLEGNETNTNGDLPEVDSIAPEFNLTDGELKDISLDYFSGKQKFLNIVPSLDTGVCATSTKKFNTAAADHDDTVFLTISADLPFAQGRFCEQENLKRVMTLSMMRDKNFAKDYGVLITDGPLTGITARAIVVLDKNNKVLYTELVSEIAQEPDYESALAVLL